MKWVLLAVVVVVVLGWLGRSRRLGARAESRRSPDINPPGQAPGQGPGQGPESAARGPSSSPQPMVACAHCGVLLPQADALRGPAARSWPSESEDRYYCCPAHRPDGQADA